MKLSDLDSKDIELVEPPKQEAHPAMKLSELHPSDIEAQQTPSTLSDAETNVAHLAGLGPIAAGAGQGVPDAIQSFLHKHAPGMVNASPTQVSAALKAMGVTGDVGPTSSGAMYRQASDERSNIENAAQKRSPYAGGAGRLAGDALAFTGAAALSPSILAAAPKGAGLVERGLTSAVNLALPGAAIGATDSSGHLVDAAPKEQSQVLSDAIHGGETASLLGMGTAVAGDLLKPAGKALADTDMGQYFKMGAEGQDLSSKASRLGTLANPEGLGDTVSMHDTQAANTVLDGLNKMDDHLGQDVGDAVKAGVNKQIRIESTPELNSQMKNLESTLGADFSDTMQKMNTQGLDPSELQEFRNDLADYGRKIYQNDPIAASEVFNATKELTAQLRQQVPGYTEAANRLNEFRQLLPETILSKDNPIDVTNLRVSGTKNVDTKLLNNIKGMIRGMYNPDNAKAQGAYTNLLQGINKLQQNEQVRKVEAQAAGKPFQTVFDKLGMQPQDIESFFKDAAAKSKLIQNYTGLPDVDFTSPLKTVRNFKDYFANQAGVIYGKTGSVAQNPVLNVGKKLYAASDDALRDLSNTLNDIPGQKPMSMALNKALDSKDAVAKNAVLFSIMQNPHLRSIVGSDNLEIKP
jgi:hypothetical protein